MSDSSVKVAGANYGYNNLASADEIRAEADWAAEAFVNSEVERTGQGLDANSRGPLIGVTAEVLEYKALEEGLDLKALNEKLFKARTGRGLVDEIKVSVGLHDLRHAVKEEMSLLESDKAHDLNEDQRYFTGNDYLRYDANLAAELMSDRKDFMPHQQGVDVDTMSNNLLIAAKYSGLNLRDLAQKLETSQALHESAQLKAEELQSYGKLRGIPEADHQQDLKVFQAAELQRSQDAQFVSEFIVNEHSTELSEVSKSEAKFELANKYIQADIKGEVDLPALKQETLEKINDKFDEIPF